MQVITDLICPLSVFVFYVIACSAVIRKIPENLKFWIVLAFTIPSIAAIVGLVYVNIRPTVIVHGDAFFVPVAEILVLLFSLAVFPPTLMLRSMWLRNKSRRERKKVARGQIHYRSSYQGQSRRSTWQRNDV
jgi:hypothetical protein